MNNDPVVISLKNVTKTYSLHHEKPILMDKIFYNKSETFTALNKINLTIKKGEKVGIIGMNGSGKTTLLKIITGIASPTKGEIKINGKIVSLIDLEAGFHPELTGIQNIYLNGMVLGMKKDEINEKIKKIIEFADINKFIDAPLFTYSNGMKLRLGFAIAVNSDPDIFILDEGIGAGDEDFRAKTMESVQKMFKDKKTILISSHWLEFIKNNCTKLLVLEHGKKVHFGNLKPIDKLISKRSNT